VSSSWWIAGFGRILGADQMHALQRQRKDTTMQVAQNRRYAVTGATIAALTVAAALILALALSAFGSSSTQVTGVTHSAAAANAFDQVAFMEANLIQIPYTVPQVRSFEATALWEANTMQVPHAAPVRTSTEVAFLEANLIQIPYVAPLRSFEETALWEANTMQVPYVYPGRIHPGSTAEE
jgi:hypothetical protein